ncbi:MAG: MGMT family protein [Ignavibacteriaceae bacterium]|nr:MGMT family protein [Ignavibacteriaceae bacterium]
MKKKKVARITQGEDKARSKMKKQDKSKKDFFDRVYAVVAKIPYGKVSTYGHIAEVCGTRASARTVGWAVNGAKESGLPCHRVVNRFGALTGRLHFGSPFMMEELLRSEGVTFDKDGNVNMDRHLWIPKMRVKSKSKRKSKM